MQDRGEVCFYTICNEPFFLGAVALINSLVLTGHHQPIVVGDCGLTPEQRAVLLQYDQVQLFKLDPSVVQNPAQYKAFPHIAGSSGVVVIIDSDMIVTGDLGPIIDKARQGKICAFPNPIENRWFAQWHQIFSLSAPPRRQIYICSCFLAVSVAHWPDMLGRWWSACEAIYSHPSYQEGREWNAPTAQADQDALNAVLMSEFPQSAVSLEPADSQAYRWDFRLVQTVDVARLRCRFRERAPVILHAALTPKPWQKAGASNDTYFKFLRRLLLGPGLVVRPPADMLDPVISVGLMPWFKRHRYFLANMGVIEFCLSYLPSRSGIMAKRTKDRIKQQFPGLRRKHA